MPKIEIKQPDPPADEVPLDVLADSIVEISRGIKKLRSTRIKDSALLLLIHHAMPAGLRVSKRHISTVLSTIENLEATYVKPNKK